MNQIQFNMIWVFFNIHIKWIVFNIEGINGNRGIQWKLGKEISKWKLTLNGLCKNELIVCSSISTKISSMLWTSSMNASKWIVYMVFHERRYFRNESLFFALLYTVSLVKYIVIVDAIYCANYYCYFLCIKNCGTKNRL